MTIGGKSRCLPFVYPVRVLAAFLIACTTASSTIVVAIWAPGAVVIGADSLEKSGDGTYIGSTCKIRKYGEFYAAFAGISIDRDTGYDVYRIASMAISHCGTIECAATNLKKAIVPELIQSLDRSRRQYGDRFFDEHFVKAAPLQSLIFGWKDGSAIIRALNFIVDATDKQLSIKVSDDGGCPGNDCAKAQVIFYGIGTYDKARSVIRAWTPSQNIPERANVIAQALNQQALASPTMVAAPFSILAIGEGFERWQDGYTAPCRDSDGH